MTKLASAIANKVFFLMFKGIHLLIFTKFVDLCTHICAFIVLVYTMNIKFYCKRKKTEKQKGDVKRHYDF